MDLDAYSAAHRERWERLDALAAQRRLSGEEADELVELYQAGEISYEDALRYADSSNEVRLRIKLAQGGDARTLAQGLDGVEVAEAR